LDTRKEEAPPFFAYLNFLEAHQPRIPAREARERILTPEEVDAGYATEASLFRTMAAMERINTFLPNELEAMRGVYDATLLELDDATHLLFEALKARGLEEDTVVVLVSDHGEHLGEKRMFDHRWSLYEPLVHVPLVIKWPGHVPAGRVKETVSTMDVFGTLFALTGVDAPEGVQVGNLMGEPSSQVHTELAVPMPRHGAIRKAYPDLPRATWQTRYHAMYENGWKLLRLSSGKHELYDMGADPAEERNRRQGMTDRVREMNTEAQQWRDTLPPYDATRRAKGDRPQPALSKTDPERQRLEALGYVDGDL
jgi:arylsulfatase A-like enzyme